MPDYSKTPASVSNVVALDKERKAIYITQVEVVDHTINLKNAAGATVATATLPDTTYTNATAAKDGLMAKEDKSKLDGLANYTLPQATAETLGGVKVTTATDSDSTTVVLAASAGKAIMEAAKAAGKSLELSGTTLKLKDANGNDLATVEIPSNYTLPTATSAVLGGVKIGQGLSVAADGTISVAISGGMRFMGAKATLAELPTEGNENGDIWLVGTKAPYAEYIWTGSA
ncbi:MAG: head fiber protein, partial [Raoultibacter sp.]